MGNTIMGNTIMGNTAVAQINVHSKVYTFLTKNGTQQEIADKMIQANKWATLDSHKMELHNYKQ
jgi:RAB protein geranylgeranyltransferase component A